MQTQDVEFSQSFDASRTGDWTERNFQLAQEAGYAISHPTPSIYSNNSSITRRRQAYKRIVPRISESPKVGQKRPRVSFTGRLFRFPRLTEDPVAKRTRTQYGVYEIALI